MKLVRYHTGEQSVHALADVKRTRIAVLIMDAAQLTVRHVPLTEQRYMRELSDYSVGDAARRFRQAGRRFGITKAARNFLKGIR